MDRDDFRDREDYEKEGVYYTPYDGEEGYERKPVEKRPGEGRPHSGGNRPPGNRPPGNRRNTPSKRRGQKSQYATFYVLTVCTGVVICIVIFAVMFNAVSKSRRAGGDEEAASPTPIASEDASSLLEKGDQTIGLVTAVNAGSRGITFYQFDNSRTTQFTVANDAELSNKYGASIVFAEVSVGDIVEISYNNGNNVTSLTQSPQAWELRNVTNVKVDRAARQITIGNDSYDTTTETIVQKKGQAYNLDGISEIDQLTAKGLKNEVYFIEVTKGHGYLELANASEVKEGSVEIDTTIFISLEEAGTIEVQEGFHRLVVKGANIEPLMQDINIVDGETVTVTLDDIDFKSGLLMLTVNESGYTARVDGDVVDTSEPVLLPYGEYTLQVEKEGFFLYEETFIIDGAMTSVNVELQQELKMGRLTVITEPSGAEVYIDNGLIGISPITAPVDYGQHKITVKKEGYLTNSFDIPVTEEKDQYVFELFRDPNYTTDPQLTPTPAPAE